MRTTKKAVRRECVIPQIRCKGAYYKKGGAYYKKGLSIDHALTCKTGGFPAIRHNEVRDITASLLSEVCHGVTIEPHLQPLTGEVMSHNTAVTEDGARLDVAMYGFWGGRFEMAFVDVRVFNPCAQSNRRSPLASVYRRHEQEKKRHYEERVNFNFTKFPFFSLFFLCPLLCTCRT